MKYTIKKLASISGVSTRALRFYDEIGLLKPAFIGENQYRYYEEEQLLLLQQILFYRELDFPLIEIQKIMNSDNFDKIAALKSHKEILIKNLARTKELVTTINKTIAHLKGELKMDNNELYSGFEKRITQASYEATAEEFAQNVAELAPMVSINRFVELLPKNGKMIDIGCGSGRDAKIFSEMGAEVLGIDFSSNLIEIAKKHAPKADFQVLDINEMNFASESFDGAWAVCSLGHITKTEFPRVLEKIYSMLKKQGWFYLALKKGAGESLIKDSRYEGNFEKFWSFYEEEELKNYLVNAKFKIIDFATVETNHHYQTHDAMRVFCQKIS